MAIWTNAGTLVVDGSNKVITCATCPCTTVNCDTECCLDGALTATVEVDLGTGPLGNEDCDACDEVGGVYQLDNTGDCVWSGSFDYTCGATNQIDCSVDKDYNGFRIAISAQLNNALCRWQVGIAMTPLLDGVVVGLDDSCNKPGSADYIGTNGDIHCDCSEMILTQNSTSNWSTICVDNMPATITIRVITDDCTEEGFTLPEALAYMSMGNGFEFVAAGNEEFLVEHSLLV